MAARLHLETVFRQPRAEVCPGRRHAVPGRGHAAAVTGGDAAASQAGRTSARRCQQGPEAAPRFWIGKEPPDIGGVAAVARQSSVGPAWIDPVRQPQSGGCHESLAVHDAYDLHRPGLWLLAEVGPVLAGITQHRSQLPLGELPAGVSRARCRFASLPRSGSNLSRYSTTCIRSSLSRHPKGGDSGIRVQPRHAPYVHGKRNLLLPNIQARRLALSVKVHRLLKHGSSVSAVDGACGRANGSQRLPPPSVRRPRRTPMGIGVESWARA